MTTPPRHTSTSRDEGIAASLVSPGLSSSLFGSGTFDSRKGLGSAFTGTVMAGGGTPDANPNSGRFSGGGGGARGDLRSKLVRERSRSSAAFASSSLQQLNRTPRNHFRTPSRTPRLPVQMAAEEEDSDEEENGEEQNPALFTNFCYRGMEVIFTAIPGDKDHECHLLGIHARTRVPFQKCHFFANSDNKNNIKPKVKIVELASHPLTGWIFAADSIGNIHSFCPTRADPMKEAYGKFRWVCGRVAKTRMVFGYSSLPVSDAFPAAAMADDSECFHRKRHFASSSMTMASNPDIRQQQQQQQQQQQHYPLNDGQPPLPNTPGGKCKQGQFRVMVRSSLTEKRVLVVHKDQLAIFDFSNSSSNEGATEHEALLLWTHYMQGAIITNCSLSGDGCAIALSLEGEGVGVPYPFGVRTFVRDWEDGSSGSIETKSDNTKSNNANNNTRPPIHKHRRTASGMKTLPESHAPPLPNNKTVDGLMENIFGDRVSSGAGAASNEQDETTTATDGQNSVSTGILYKPGQFLVHSSPVTRLSFRGFGTRTSAIHHNSGWSEQEEGNDLLLTSCSGDCSVRIFSQNSWRQLMHWTSPTKSRADWVRGISAANVGDLDSSPTNDTKKKKTKEELKQTPNPKDGANTSVSTGQASSTQQSQQRNSQLPTVTPTQSCDTSVASDASGGINRVLLGGNHAQTSSTLPSHSVPGTHAGAWIAELTFRNAFPALRLSRLSYMRTGGDDALPAHFESVAAILPPGSLNEEVLLAEDDDGNLNVEGIWPVWDPWEPDLKKNGAGSGDAGNSKPGSNPFGGSSVGGMATVTSGALLSPTAAGPRFTDGFDLGGTHFPPSEVRITSSYSNADCLVQIEMPLWGDKDFGATEFGAPMRHVMSMPERRVSKLVSKLPCANLEYESGSRLCARVSLDNRSIQLLWRKHGAINLERLSCDIDSVEQFRDLCLTPLPICLPSLSVPGVRHKSSVSDNMQSPLTLKHAIASLHWWPDENFGGPPRLVALTQGGTIIVYEMPPPWSALEPPMPSYDPFDGSESRGSSVYSDFGMMEDDDAHMSQDDFHDENRRTVYEVAIAPHPDFGLGLRLEAQAQGMPAIAGSFKKHPLSGGRLPAERSGSIALGDELLAVNDVNLEGYRFEDTIATVRQLGFDSLGEPLRMRFRRCNRGKRSGSSSKRSSTGNRTPDSRSPNVIIDGIDDDSLATVEVGADAEYQQEFGRIIAVVRDAIMNSPDSPRLVSQTAMLLLPWNFGKGAVVSNKMYGGALVLWAVPGKRTIKAARLEAVLDIDPENARFDVIGSVSMEDNKKGDGATIRSITFVRSTETGWMVAVCDYAGDVALLFIEISGHSSNNSDARPKLTSTFRQYSSIFNIRSMPGNKVDPSDSFIMRPFSIELFGCMNKCVGGCKELNIFSALPYSVHSIGGRDIDSTEYCNATIYLNDVKGHASDVILDFCWVSSGFMDAFPWLLVFTQSAAILYHRSCLQNTWGVIAILSYTERLCLRSSSPYDLFPHLVTAFRSAIPSNDERTLLRSGWHPESILASICTEEDGVKLALNSYVRGIYTWLSQWMVSDESMRPSWVGHGSLSNVPFRVLNDKSLLSNEDKKENETSAALVAAYSTNLKDAGRKQSKDTLLVSELQSALYSIIKEYNDEPKRPRTQLSKEFLLAMSQESKTSDKRIVLPPPLQKMSQEELRCLWAMGEILASPPSFEKLDSYSQLCLFCVSMMRNLLDGTSSSNGDSNDTTNSVNAMLSYEGGRPVLASPKKSNSTLNMGEAKFDSIASAGYLSALMSDTQMLLTNSCRPIGETFNWNIARSIGLPFWMRSQKELVSIAEEIAQTIYKDTRKVMDCALYYIAMRNMKKLRAIAATDRSDSGKTFFRFISDNDFSSEQGRHSAEKNAYSLLRKRKYASAASFFLLTEPPMLKTALDVIRLQLQDTSLAFFVARLIENATTSCAPTGNESLTIGGAFNLSSMGGGGGFAGSSSTMNVGQESAVRFADWKPELGPNARAVLVHRATNADYDGCLESLKLLWLGHRNEAKLRLAHIRAEEAKDVVMQYLSVPYVACDPSVKENSSSTSVIRRTNAVINFCSGPILLKGLNPKKRVLWSSALLVSRALGGCGIEIPAARILQRIADPLYEEKASLSVKNRASKSSDASGGQSAGASSSIFDAFDTVPPQRKQTKPVQEEKSSSSIFDSYDTAPPSKPTTRSIFDSFDAVPQKPHSAPIDDESMCGTTSSIFDSFDTAPQKPKSTPSQPTSFFDSSNPPPQKPKSESGEMTSSIFDSFVSSPQKPKSTTLYRPETSVELSSIDSACEAVAEQDVYIPEFPAIWNEWRNRLIHLVAARTLLRELARIVSSFHGDPHLAETDLFAHRTYPLIPIAAAEVLRNSCDSEGLLSSLYKSVSELSVYFGIDENTVTQLAWELMSSSLKPRRIIYAVLLQCLLGRGDLIEDLVRDVAARQTNSAEFLGLANDTIIDENDTKYYITSQFGRRESANIVWQLELCLWLHRGGAFEMSAKAVKETVLAIRIGIATSSWGRCHQSLETLLKAEPDYPMDFDAGKNLWRSMKIIVVSENGIDGVEGVSSGGWEFLVDCRRDEATEMLRDGKPGQFLIRPHPQDPGVFTLSFRTNLVPTELTPVENYDEAGAIDRPQQPPQPKSPQSAQKIVKRDDVVQHAIIRLTDSGFRCGSFGPFVTLVKLLHAVSQSLPFDLRFNDPPIKGVIKERGALPSPNSFLFRKMALQSKGEFFRFHDSFKINITEVDDCTRPVRDLSDARLERCFGLFAQLIFLTELRKQLCALAAAVDDDAGSALPRTSPDEALSDDFDGSISEGSLEMDEEEVIGVACRMIRPILNLVRSKEIDIIDEIAPLIGDIDQNPSSTPLSSIVDEESVQHTRFITGGDSIIRRMIQAGSGVDFRTLRVGEAGNSIIVVLFGKKDAVKWMILNGIGSDKDDAEKKLKIMEMLRIIEPITSSDLSIPKSYAATHPTTESRYRFVDPWEVEALESKAGETANAALGRSRYQALSVGQIACSCEKIVRITGGLHLLGLWSTLKGGVTLTKALCSAHPPWERDAGGDLLMKGGFLLESSPFENSIRQHLYGNSLFRRLNLPQRFLALLQVELLDLKNVTSPSGSSSLTAYALLRLKRQGSSAPLNQKARSLDSACTQPRKISKNSGLNAPASWGSLVRFRFPLPEFVNCEGKSLDADRESLFKGPPSCLQVTAYEKKFMSDAELGGADINLESLGSGGQIEEWVPLRAGRDGITWFARIRISLRFELMCMDSSTENREDDRSPSVGLQKIQYLSRLGAHEDSKGVKNSISTPDLAGYFGSMLY